MPEHAIKTQAHSLLYVEDNLANLKLMESIVARRPGMRLLCAQTGTKGVEMARASPPEAILMDINLPDISGFMALQLLRADPATQHIPVIALSANVLPINIASGLEAGFFRYLTKPIVLEEFTHALDEALDLRAVRASAHTAAR